MGTQKIILQKITDNGGWVNAHAHFDRAFTVAPDLLTTALASLKDKWYLLDEIKKLQQRIRYIIEWPRQPNV